MNATEKDNYLRKKFDGRAISAPYPEAIEKTKLVVFDFDETMVESRTMFINLNRRAMDMLHLPYSEEVVRDVYYLGLNKYIGWGRNFAEQLYIFEHKFSPLVTELCNQEEFISQVKLYEGIREVIKLLAKTDIKLAVASSRDLYSIIKVLKRERLFSYFDIIQATEGGKRFKDKPHPQIVNYIAQEVGIPLEKSVMIGDTSGDIKMGKEAGMKTIGIGYGKYSTADDIKNLKPDAMILSTKEIKRIPQIVYSLMNER